MQSIINSRWRDSLSFCIFSTIPGWLLAFITGYSLIADMSALWSSYVMLGWLWNQIGYPVEMIRLVRLGSAVLIALQAISWLVASSIHRFILKIPIENSLKSLMGGGLDLPGYMLALVYISIFSLMLSYLGSKTKIYSLEKKLCLKLLQLKNISVSYQLTIALIFTVIEVTLTLYGVIGQRTIVAGGYSDGELPYWIVFYESVLPAHILLNSLIFVSIFKEKSFISDKYKWLIFTISVISLLFIYFNKGRSNLVFALIAHGYWLSFFTARRIKPLKFVILGMILYPIVSQVLLFSNFLRNEDTGLVDWQVSAIAIIPQAWESFQSSSNLVEREKDRTAENISTRPLVAAPLALCIRLDPSEKNFLFGKEILHSMIWSIPGPLINNKKEFPKQEDLLYMNFPIGQDDTADSLYLSSYTEFWWIGIFIYPLLIVLLWKLVLNMIQIFKLSNVTIAITVTPFLEMFILGIGESAVNTWIITLRSFLFWLLINSLINSLFFRWIPSRKPFLKKI